MVPDGDPIETPSLVVETNCGTYRFGGDCCARALNFVEEAVSLIRAAAGTRAAYRFPFMATGSRPSRTVL